MDAFIHFQSPSIKLKSGLYSGKNTRVRRFYAHLGFETFGMINSGVVQNDHDFTVRIVVHYFFEKLKEDLGIIMVCFCCQDFPGFIVQCAKKFGAPMLAVGENKSLFFPLKNQDRWMA